MEEKTDLNVSKYIAAIIAVGLLVWGGMILYNHYHHKTAKQSAASTNFASNPAETLDTTTPQVPYINVVQSDNTVTQETSSQVVRTNDQLSILETLRKTCTGTDAYLSMGSTTFDDDSQNFRQQGNYAAINVGICNPAVKNFDDLPDGGAESYLHKDSNGAWILDTPNESVADCAKVDGLGYPTTIMPTCTDGADQRAPK